MFFWKGGLMFPEQQLGRLPFIGPIIRRVGEMKIVQKIEAWFPIRFIVFFLLAVLFLVLADRLLKFIQ